MNEIIFPATITGGELNIKHIDKFQQEYSRLKDGDYEIVLRKRGNKRSVEQNRWMWACTRIMANELGYSADEFHAIINYKFLTTERVDEKTGELYKYIASSSSLSKHEFSLFMESLIRWAAETFSIVLPLPGVQTEMDYQEPGDPPTTTA